MSENQKWTTIIKPKDKALAIDFKELWQYRDLYTVMVKRNITVQYKQTVLGPLWFIIQPIMTIFMYMVVFGGIAGIGTDGIPKPLFYLSGTAMWHYFSDCLGKTSGTFRGNSVLFSKVYFPRIITPLVNVTSNLLRFFIQIGLFIAIYIFYFVKGDCPASPNWYLLLFPILVLMMAGLALGFGMVITSMTTKYRDLGILFGFVTSLWMYATPIVYPLSLAKGKVAGGIELYNIMRFNPVTPVLETFKYGALGAGEFIGWEWLGYSFCFMILMIFFGLIVFNKTQKSFLDTV